MFTVLRYFTYDGCTVDFSKEVKHWKCVKSECGVPIIIRKSIFEEISKKLNDSELWIDKWDDILIDYAKKHTANEKTVMVLSVIHPFILLKFILA